MTDEVFFYQTTQFFSAALSIGLWNFLEIFFGLFIFVAGIIQRVYIESFKTKEDLHFFDVVITKIGQLGLYFQIFLGLISFTHGWANAYVGQTNPFMTLWCFGTACIKFKDLMVWYRTPALD